MKKNELNTLVVAYATANEKKKAITAEVKDMGDEIKDIFEEKGIDTFEALGWVATVVQKKGKRLNLEKVAALLGGEIPADCYEDTLTPALIVKPAKAAKPLAPAVVAAKDATAAVVVAA